MSELLYRILLLEDEPQHAALLEAILGPIANVRTVANSEEFFQVVHGQPRPDLCIVDNRVPGDPSFAVKEVGVQTVETLRSFLRLDVPAILCTGYDLEPEDMRRLQELGVTVLTKPFDNPAAVRELIRREIQRPVGMTLTGATERHGVAWFDDLPIDSNVVLDEQYHLRVQITETAVVDSGVLDATLLIPGSPPLELLVLAVGEGLQIGPENGHVIAVPSVGDSGIVTFNVAANPDEGYGADRLLRVHFYHEREWLQSVEFPLRVSWTGQKRTPVVPPAEPRGREETELRIDPDYARKPDLSLHWCNTGGVPRGYIINSHTADEAFQHLSSQDWEDLNDALRKTIQVVENEAEKGAESTALDELVGVGRMAYNRIFPNSKTRGALSKLLRRGIASRVRSPYVYIWTDKHHLIPWEALYSGPPDSETDNATAHFWGMGCIVEKVCVSPVSHALARGEFDIRPPVAVGLAWNRRFDDVGQCELSLLKQIEMDNDDALSYALRDRAEPLDEFMEFLEQPWDLLQFACHCEIAENPLESYLEFTDGTKLELTQLLNNGFEFAKQPLVVLSSCSSLFFDARRTSGFFQEFIGRGACGVLGTLVPVRSRFASRFVCNVYYHLFQGQPIGEAVRKSRNECWTSARSLVGLTYSHYGDVRTTLPVLQTSYTECTGCVEGGCLLAHRSEGN